MKELSLKQAEALCKWAIENHETNWGVWGNYPLSGCSYLQYDNNRLIVKFDEMMSFAGETFKRIGWDRNIPQSNKAITFSTLFSQLKKKGIDLGTYPEKRFTKTIDGNEISYLIRQSEYADFPSPEVCLLTPNGDIYRTITKKSKYYPFGEI